MNEASVTTSFKDKLKEHGFFVRKIADKTTQGLPDLIAIWNAKVFFLEVKYFERTHEPKEFKAFSAIPMQQLMTMVELSKHGAKASYILFFKIPKMKLQLCSFHPTNLLWASKDNVALPIKQLQPIDSFINEMKFGPP